MGRFIEYENYYNKYSKIYGEKTVVLYQCGMFHEIYGIDNETEKVGNAKEISSILNIQLTRTTKVIIENSRSNPLMTGFPSIHIDRYTNILIEDNWTVIVVDQEKINGTVTRKVSGIWSPATYINKSVEVDNYLVSLYIQLVSQRNSKALYCVGMTAIDVTTGISYIHESYSNQYDPNYSIDETCRFVQAFQPKEIIINCSQEIKDNLLNLFSFDDIKLHITLGKNKMESLSYQNKFLEDIFTGHGKLSGIEYLGIEKYLFSIRSYINLLKFASDHSRILLNNLKKPYLWSDTDNLVLDNNTINQLNLINGTKSVFKIINFTSTNMGKRLLKIRLLNPVTSKKILEERYSEIEFMLSNSGKTMENLNLIETKNKRKLYWWEIIENHLKPIIDIERFHRKAFMGVLQPCELSTLNDSYDHVMNILKTLSGTQLGDTQLLKDFTNYREWLLNIIDPEEAAKYNMNGITDSFFKRGYNSNLDSISDQIRSNNRKLQLIASNLSDMIDMGGQYVKIKCNDKEGFYLDITKPRFKTLEKLFKPTKLVNSLSSFNINRKNKNNVKLSGGNIDIINNNIKDLTNKLITMCTTLYNNLLQETNTYQKLLNKIDYYISWIDLIKSNAKCTTKNNYCKPNIFDTNSEGNFIRVSDLRHPIIEKILTKTKYVPHTLELSKGSNGVLLYGINASGKSSIMKAVGISLILAQSGFYVPATKFECTPYQLVMTRIIGNDDLFKGLSSFAVEMSELRGILSRNNDKTLVLGDEICHGTETSSAISLVAASLMYLSQKNTSYIFATHLHQLSKMKEITDIPNLKQYHLTMHHDKDLDEIIYDRKLKNGSGPSNYGIQVAKAMGVPIGIIDSAFQIQQKYFGGGITELFESKYNSSVILSKCQIPKCGGNAEDTHHIQFQAESDENNYIGSMHKNAASNLVGLCKFHHNMVHKPTDKELIILGYTDSGKLRFKMRKPYKSFYVRNLKPDSGR